MEKKVITLADLVSMFACFGTEELIDKIVRYYEVVKEDKDGEFPFPLTDADWAQSLMDTYLQSDDGGYGIVDLFKVFQYGINDYVAACIKENPLAAYLVEQYRDEDAFSEPATASLPAPEEFFDISARWQDELEAACEEYEYAQMQKMSEDEINKFRRQYNLAQDAPNHII